METKTDILVIGGGPAGIISAVTARKYYKDKKILLIKNIAQGVVPCGIPYMFASLCDPEENKLGNAPLEKNNIEFEIDEAAKISRKEKTLETTSGNIYRYEKLILAHGSSPIVPPIPGIDKKGVFPIQKDMNYLKGVVGEVKKAKNVLVVGGGFIGVEFADEVSTIPGINVYLVELMPRLMANSFDPEFSELAQHKLESQGVHVLTDTKVENIIGNEHVEKVLLSNGKEIVVDSIILGVGSMPNISLAVNAGLDLGRGKGIWVDEYMRTSDPDIFAVGDCAGKRDFYTHRDTPVMLASTATAEARIAGANLYALKVVRENKGTIAVYSTFINGLALGSAGLTEMSAKKEGFEIVVGQAQGIDKHPATLPNGNTIQVKLIFSKQSGIILGGQVSGGISCGELINLLGVAIQKRMSATELETLQMATHPCLTSAPTTYPVVLASQNALEKMK
jgi:NADH oxidase (H2O2-forming)